MSPKAKDALKCIGAAILVFIAGAGLCFLLLMSK